MGGKYSRYIVRFIVAAYLIYLGVQLISGVIKGTDNPDNPWLFVLFGVLFIVIAAVLIVTSLIKMKNEPDEASMEPAEEITDNEPEQIEENG